MIILWVTACAMGLAGYRRREERYWVSWSIANLVLGVALCVFLFERSLPPFLVATLPNGLLVLGMALRWRAAREFGGRPAPGHYVWAPFLVFVGAATLLIPYGYAPVFVTVNLVLAVLACGTAAEFWRDRHDGLPSRMPLVAAYLLMGLSFTARVPLGFHNASAMQHFLPHDVALAAHLTIAVIYTVATGVFALSLAHERGNARLHHAATHDGLTGLLNRTAFEAAVGRQLHRRNGGGFALALIDMDHFKQINDEYGHGAGDEALRRFAAIAREIAGPKATVARIGGEEFAILMPDATPEQARSTVDRLRMTMKAMILGAEGRFFRITLSAGLCHSADAPRSFDQLMRSADQALYAAKNGGRDRVERFAA